MGASVRARLLNLAKQRGQPFDLLLTRYALERLLEAAIYYARSGFPATASQKAFSIGSWICSR